MSKWKCEICNKEFDNFHAQGFDNKIYCPLCFFKEKTIRLENRINKAVGYIEKHRQVYDIDGSVEPKLDDFDILASPKYLINLLKGDKE